MLYEVITVTTTTVVTYATTRNVIQNHAIAFFETTHAFATFYNLTAWLVTGNFILITFRTFT